MQKQPLIASIIVLFLTALSHTLFARNQLTRQPLSPRIANYKIEVLLDTQEKAIEGYERITWRNDSKDIISELQFHLYMNAFKNSESTFMKEIAISRGKRENSFKDWGFIRIDSMKIVDGPQLTSAMEYIQLDDGNEADQTVMRVILPDELPPGKTIELDTWFYVKLPQIYARTGYTDDDFYLIGQWFPKMGVYINGEWNCHQFHRHSEFFADFGVYDVTITLPEELIAGATGVLQSEKKNADRTKTVIFHAEDVHDFAWTASPHFLIAEDQFEQVKIMFYHQPNHQHQVQRHIETAKQTMGKFKEWFGEYPYSTLTIVDPPISGMRASGMEYPTFITAGTASFLPKGMRFPEMVTEHEFGHNYWQGMVASNEFEEAWLDEGVNTYFEIKMMEQMFGMDANIVDCFGLKIGEREFHRKGYIAAPSRDPIAKNSWEFYPKTYGNYSYSKAALMLLTLENYLGPETMAKIMKTYFQRWKFKHPQSHDFIEIANEVSGQNLDWYFDQTLYGSDFLDYEVAEIRTSKVRKPKGIGFEKQMQSDSAETADSFSAEVSDDSLKTDSLKANGDAEAKTNYRSYVLVRRNGGVISPVELLIKFDDGAEILENWDGKARWHRFKYTKSARIVSAQIDPETKVWLDINFTNNSRTVDSLNSGPNRWWLKWLFWVQNLMQLVSSMS